MKSNNIDEVDLKELITILIKGWKTILITLTLSISIGILIYLNLPEKWESEAKISKTTINQLSNYPELDNFLKKNESEKNNLDNISEYFFSLFLSELDDFIINNNYSATLKNKNDKNAFLLSVVSNTGQESNSKINEILSKANNETLRTINLDVKLKIENEKIKALTSINKYRKIGLIEKERRIINLKKSLEISKKITDEDKKNLFQISDYTLFLLGTKNLELLIAQEELSPIIFNDEFYYEEEKFKNLNEFKLKTNDIKVAKVIINSSSPIKKSPNFIIFIILSIFTGLFLSFIFLYIKKYFHKIW
ncbi:Wzz/FepE/Etk N-terminal domain-containing protein [Yersinia enterocolitica]